MGYRDLNFDSIDIENGYQRIPYGQGHLDWIRFYDAKPSEAFSSYPDSGYFTGITSGDQVACTSGGRPSSFGAGSFDLRSLNITAAWKSSLDVEIRVFDADRHLMSDSVITITDKQPTHLELNLVDISYIGFYPGRGIDDPRFDHRSKAMVFDDIEVANIVPFHHDNTSPHAVHNMTSPVPHVLEGWPHPIA